MTNAIHALISKLIQYLEMLAFYMGFILVLQGSQAIAEELVFCRPNNMVSAFAYIAEEQGFFKEEGLNLRYETATNFKICQDLMIAGKADIANGGDGPFTYIAPSNPPFKLVSFIQKNPETSVFARADHGIKGVEDLKGRRVGYLPGTVSSFFLDAILKTHGLSMKDVILVSMQTPTMTQALIGGAVDAIVTWEPWGAHAMVELKDRGIQFEDPQERYYCLLVVSDKLIAEKPEEVRKLLRAFMKAEKYLQTHQPEARKYLANKVVMPEEIMARYWPRYEHRMWIDGDAISRLEKRFAALVEMDRNYAGKPTPNFRDLIDSKFLKELAPDRVDSGL